MTLLIRRRGPAGRGARLAKTDPGRRPVDEEHLADEVPPRHRSPDPRIARRRPVVAHEEVVARQDPGPRAGRLVVAPGGLDVGLVELLAVDVHVAVALAHD